MQLRCNQSTSQELRTSVNLNAKISAVMKAFLLLSALFLLAASSPLQNTTELHCTGDCQQGDDASLMTRVMRLKLEEHKKCVEQHQCPTVANPLSNVPCVNGKSEEFSCSNIDLLSFVPLIEMGSNGDGNDIWGWTDPETKKEYAIVGCADGTSFVDVTDPMAPKVMGFMKTATSSSLWRDIKVFKDHAFIVSEARNHGMQVYDLTKLRDLTPGLNDLEPTAYYTEMGNTHNIVANEDTGYMYAVGTSTCRGGLHMIDVNDPANPKFAGCFDSDGYVHDAQCVIYKGPDDRYTGKEICFCYNENSLTIVDVTDKSSPEMLGRESYDQVYYTHQGWLNEAQSHLLLNDELDEVYGTNKHTRSMIWNVKDLTKPELTGSFYSTETAVDHNLYIRGNLAYESNYCAGLRILDISTMTDEVPDLKEVGYFDLAPECDSPEFHGAWSSYVYFDSQTIIVNSIERGLFVLKYTGTQ